MTPLFKGSQWEWVNCVRDSLIFFMSFWPPLHRLPKRLPAPWQLKRLSQNNEKLPLQVRKELALYANYIGIQAPLPTPSVQLRLSKDHSQTKAERQRKIEENMNQMPKRIAQYREERRKLKEQSKPDMPF